MFGGKTSVDSAISTGLPAVAGTDHVLGPNFALINDMKSDYTCILVCPDMSNGRLGWRSRLAPPQCPWKPLTPTAV